MTTREENLKGRVKMGWSSAYQVDERGRVGKMVSFIDRDLNILSYSYSTLHIASATDSYLRLEFTTGEVLIKGRNLAVISRAIASHRLVYLSEARLSDQDADSTSPVADEMAFVLRQGQKSIRDHAEGEVD